MNFLAKTLGSLTGTSIPYNFIERVESQTLWTCHSGTSQKDDKIKVTIFEFSLREPRNSGLVDLARNAFKKSKLIKFPGIIQIIDFIENDSFLYVITEPVTPLGTYLTQHGTLIDDNIKIFGLYNIAKTMSFINRDANSLHGSLNSRSIFVNDCGDWKVWGFELMTSLTSDPDQPIYRLSARYSSFRENLPPEVKEGGVEAIKKSPFKFDAYMFGVLIYQLFNGPINDFADSQSTKNISKSILPGYKRLISSFGVRVTIDNFFKNGESTFFKNNDLVNFSNELNELNFKTDVDKLNFLNSLSKLRINFPPGFIEFKVLPELIVQFNNNMNSKIPLEDEEGRVRQQEHLSIILSHILKFGEKLTDENFNYFLKPVFLRSFTLPDRSIRLMLLHSLPIFIKKLTKNDIQDKIFTNLITGFQDTNVAIREETVKSMILVADKLSDRQLNNDLLRYLAKSQIDPQASIRTNTIIVIANIAPFLNKSSRSNVLITALSKSLKDPFTPCKLNSLLAFNMCIDYFTPELCCTKILGVISFCLMDKNSKVRQEAKTCFDHYMNKINEAAEKLPVNDEIDEELGSTNEFSTPNNKDSFGFGWNVVNKLTNTIGGQLNNEFNNSTPDLTRNTSPTPVAIPMAQAQQASENWDDDFTIPKATTKISTLSIDDEVDEGDGWGLDDEIEPVFKLKPKPKTVAKPAPRVSKKPSPLQLKKKPNAPGSTLKLNLKVDDVDDWGGDDGW